MSKPKPQAGAGTFGAALRKRRQRRGVSLQEVSQATRVVSRYLQALENEAIETLPGGTYNRAYLRMYAEYLGLDAGELLRQYEAAVQSREASSGSAAGPDAVTVMRAAAQRRASERIRRARVVAIGLRVIAATAATAAVLAIVTWVRIQWFPRGSDIDTLGRSVQRPAEPPLQAEPIAPTLLRVAPLAPPGLAAESRSDLPPPIRAADTNAAIRTAGPDPALLESGAGAHALVVPGAGVGTEVVDRRLVGEADTFAVGSSIVFWTLVTGGRAGEVVRHVWMHDGLTVATIELALGSDHWRTYSRMTLDADSEGEWIVEARDREDHVLAHRAFHCHS